MAGFCLVDDPLRAASLRRVEGMTEGVWEVLGSLHAAEDGRTEGVCLVDDPLRPARPGKVEGAAAGVCEDLDWL